MQITISLRFYIFVIALTVILTIAGERAIERYFETQKLLTPAAKVYII